MTEQAGTAQARTIVITGGTDGIGRALAQQLFAQGHRLILLARNPDKAAGVCRALTDGRGEAQPGSVDWIRCDLASLSSVRSAAAELSARHPRIDVLVNNAAIFGREYEETQDGLESHLAVNYLAPFLLTHLLLPPLLRAGRARIVNVSGETARIARIKLDDLGRRRHFGVLAAYGQSKLALILFTRTLAERIDPSQVTINALHPGAVQTGHVSAGPRWMARIWDALVRGRGPERAAAAVARLAVDSRLAEATGRYYFGTLRAPAPFSAYRRGLREALYETSAKLVQLEPALLVGRS